MEKYISHGENDTENFAYNFAKNLKKENIICLTGNLGTGKTRFMQGIARYFGIENMVSSPTFTIVNEYTTCKNNENIKTIFHFDVYRLENSEDFENTVGTDYFNLGLCVIEWGEIIKDIFPIKNTIYITIENTENEDERIINIKGDIE